MSSINTIGGVGGLPPIQKRAFGHKGSYKPAFTAKGTTGDPLRNTLGYQRGMNPISHDISMDQLRRPESGHISTKAGGRVVTAANELAARQSKLNEFLNIHKNEGKKFDGLGITETAAVTHKNYVARNKGSEPVEDRFIPEFLRAQSQGRVKSQLGNRA